MYKLLYKLQYTKHKPAAATRLLYAAAVHKRERLRKKYITRRSWSVRTSTSRRSGPSTSLARKAGLLEDTWLCWTASLDSPPSHEQKKTINNWTSHKNFTTCTCTCLRTTIVAYYEKHCAQAPAVRTWHLLITLQCIGSSLAHERHRNLGQDANKNKPGRWRHRPSPGLTASPPPAPYNRRQRLPKPASRYWRRWEFRRRHSLTQ